MTVFAYRRKFKLCKMFYSHVIMPYNKSQVKVKATNHINVIQAVITQEDLSLIRCFMEHKVLQF